MLDHIILNVKSVETSKEFYRKALASLGYEIIMEIPGGVGFGVEGKPDFWISNRAPVHTNVHVAFHCKERSRVDAFYDAAIAAGGLDNGKPGVRAMYHPNYYGAFVYDPDGNNVEAVCHEPSG